MRQHRSAHLGIQPASPFPCVPRCAPPVPAEQRFRAILSHASLHFTSARDVLKYGIMTITAIARQRPSSQRISEPLVEYAQSPFCPEAGQLTSSVLSPYTASSKTTNRLGWNPSVESPGFETCCPRNYHTVAF